MKRIILFMSFVVLSLSGCRGSSYPPDCAADGPDCRQFNPNLNKRAAPPINPELLGCAADGPDCKQFNPNKL